MPAGAVYVGRPTKWGNPFLPARCREAGYQGTDLEIKQRCVAAYSAWLIAPDGWLNWQGEEAERRKAAILDNLAALRGKDLACWCPLDKPCHADVLLELANEGAQR